MIQGVLEVGIGDFKVIWQWAQANWAIIVLIVMLVSVVYLNILVFKAFVRPWISERRAAMDTICSLAGPLTKIAEQYPQLDEHVRKELVTLMGKVNDLNNITNGIGKRMSIYEEDREKQNMIFNEHRERFVKLETKVDILMEKL